MTDTLVSALTQSAEWKVKGPVTQVRGGLHQLRQDMCRWQLMR